MIYVKRLIRQYVPILLLATFLIVPVTSSHAASLTDLNNQLKQAQDTLTKYQALQQNEKIKSTRYTQQIDDAKAQIASVQNTIKLLQSQIGSKENAINNTQAAIEAKINDINQKNDALNKSMVDYYIFSNSSFLDVATIQSNLSAFDDQSQYLQTLLKTITDQRTALAMAKKDFEDQQTKLQQERDNLAALKGQAENKNLELVSQKNQTVSLLNQSLSNTQLYKQNADHVSAQVAALRHQIDAAAHNVGSRGGTGGYPYANWTIDVADPWGELTRECTSYVSWYWAKLGKHITDANHHGNADQYANIARVQGFRTTYDPNIAGVNSIVMWSNFGGVGHVAIVTAINNDGTIDTSEYNSGGDYIYYTFPHLNYRAREHGSKTVFIY